MRIMKRESSTQGSSSKVLDGQLSGPPGTESVVLLLSERVSIVKIGPDAQS